MIRIDVQNNQANQVLHSIGAFNLLIVFYLQAEKFGELSVVQQVLEMTELRGSHFKISRINVIGVLIEERAEVFLLDVEGLNEAIIVVEREFFLDDFSLLVEEILVLSLLLGDVHKDLFEPFHFIGLHVIHRGEALV